MQRLFKKIIHHEFAKKEWKIDKLTSKEKIIQLLESLHPFQTQFDLIRMGPNGDGGYLVPNDLTGIDACFSPGVDKISEFEHACIKYGMKIFMADKSVDKPNWDIPESEYGFLKKFIGCTNNESFITMDNWFKSTQLSEDSELLLQMDIEGAEYVSFINMSDALIKRFRIMVIEFHDLDFLWQPSFFGFAETVFKKILQTHVCVHIHPNNCCGVRTLLGVEIPRVEEFTFLRKDRSKLEKYQTKFPHKLDFDNTGNMHIPLHKFWYKSS